MSINQIIISGYVGKDPEALKFDDVVYAKFSLAKTIKSRSGEDKTYWHQVISNKHQTETILNHVKSGDKLVVCGYPIPKAYLNKEKQLITYIEIKLTSFEFCSKKDGGIEKVIEVEIEESAIDSTEIETIEHE